MQTPLPKLLRMRAINRGPVCARTHIHQVRTIKILTLAEEANLRGPATDRHMPSMHKPRRRNVVAHGRVNRKRSHSQKHIFLNACTLSGISYEVLGMRYQVIIRHRVTGGGYQVSSIECRVSCIEERVSGTEYRTSDMEYRVSGIEYRIASVEQRLSNLE